PFVGAWLGFAHPSFAVNFKVLGDAFIKAIRMIVAPIIFATVVGLAKMVDLRRVASVGLKSLIYFEVASTLALLVGITVGNLWPGGAGMNLDPAKPDPHAEELLRFESSNHIGTHYRGCDRAGRRAPFGRHLHNDWHRRGKSRSGRISRPRSARSRSQPQPA